VLVGTGISCGKMEEERGTRSKKKCRRYDRTWRIFNRGLAQSINPMAKATHLRRQDDSVGLKWSRKKKPWRTRCGKKVGLNYENNICGPSQVEASERASERARERERERDRDKEAQVSPFKLGADEGLGWK